MKLRLAALPFTFGFIAALAASIAADDLPAMIAFRSVSGKTVALLTLGLLLSTIAWGARAAGRSAAVSTLLHSLLPKHRRLVALGALLWLFAAARPVHLEPSPSLTDLYRLVVSLLAPMAGFVLTVVAAIRLAPGTRLRRHAPAALAPLLLAGVAALVSFAVLERAPHIPDEIAYLFDARNFAAGERVSAPPPVPAAFPAPEWIEVEAERAYGVFPPGWPLVLSLGVLAGMPWLVNAVIGAMAVLLITALARHASPGEGEGAAGASPIASWLAATSPFVIVLSASYMAHPVAMLWTLVALVSYLRLLARPRLASALALAFAAALLGITRPIEAIALLVAIVADALRGRPRGDQPRSDNPPVDHRDGGPKPAPRARAGLGLVALAIGLAAASALTLADQARLTGDPLIPPVNRYFDRHHGPGSNRLGFGPDIGLTWDGSPPGHTPLEAAWNLSLNLAHLNRHLTGWPAGSLLLVFVFLLSPVRKTRAERLLLVHAAALLLLYALYWYHGVAYGPRFLTSLVPGLTLFTWRGAGALGSWLERQLPGNHWNRTVRAGIIFSIACGLGLYLPLKAASEYRGLRGIDGTLLRQVEAAPTPALILVDGPVWPDYDHLYYLNAPDYRGPRVVARLSRGRVDQEVERAYPGRVPRILSRSGPVH